MQQRGYFYQTEYFHEVECTGRGSEGHGPLLFCVAKRKKGNKGKKRVSKQKLLKDCHQGQNVIVLAILECLEFKKFKDSKFFLSANHGRTKILFNVPWPLHFEIHFAGPVKEFILQLKFTTLSFVAKHTFFRPCQISETMRLKYIITLSCILKNGQTYF